MTPPSLITRVPDSSPRVRVVMVTFETAAMEASASPRKPSERRSNRSSARVILLVALRSKAMRTSSRRIPLPLSVTRR